MMSARRILIIGGSTRAAADSVRRAGWQPICADMFADLDLRTTAEVIPVRHYPDSLPEDVCHVRADGWFYCGALENRPDIIERMLAHSSRFGPLLGTPPDVLRRVRNPEWLRDTLRAAGIRALELARSSSPPAHDGTWLQKPLASAGGRSIRIWDHTAARQPLNEPHYFQRRVAGVGWSAVFSVQDRVIHWLGGCRELRTNFCETPTPFLYCGSCGPLKVVPFVRTSRRGEQPQRRAFQSGNLRTKFGSEIEVRGCAIFHTKIQAQLTAIARTLVANLKGLRGVIGLDFCLDGSRVWLVEVNPRYTASVEVLELATGRSLLNANATDAMNPGSRGRRKVSVHGAAPDRSVGPVYPLSSTAARSAPRWCPRVIVKQILYARSNFVAPDLSRHLENADPWRLPTFADIPVQGTNIEAGWPICTVLAGGPDIAAATRAVQQQILEIQARLTS